MDVKFRARAARCAEEPPLLLRKDPHVGSCFAEPMLSTLNKQKWAGIPAPMRLSSALYPTPDLNSKVNSEFNSDGVRKAHSTSFPSSKGKQ